MNKRIYWANLKFFLSKKLVVFLGILVFSFSALHAEWDPESCFLDESEAVLNELNNADYKFWKNTMKDYLKQSWCSQEKIDLLMDVVLVTKPKVCVEIGAFSGSSVLPIGLALKFLGSGRIYAIDAWSNTEVIKYLAHDDPNTAWWYRVNMDEAYNTFQNRINKYRLNNICTVIRGSSVVAANQVDQIDFLHLDGDFSEKGSLQDLDFYLPKVKEGGYILLSNVLMMIDGKQPKLKAFCSLFETCELIAEIDNSNTALFKKM